MTENGRAAEQREEETVYLFADEQGIERELVPIYTFDYRDRAYVVLIDRNDAEADGVIFRMDRDGEEVVLANVEDDEEWEAVAEIYEDIASRNENG